MKLKPVDRQTKAPPGGVRGKYAAAFKKGVKVIEHHPAGDKIYRVTRTPTGEFRWEPLDSGVGANGRSRSAFTLIELPAMSKGFTLVELLVVVTIIVVLLALLVPAMDKAIYQTMLLQCATNQKAVGTAVINYTFDNKRFYPARRVPTGDNLANYNPLALVVPEDDGYDLRPVLREMGLSPNRNTQCVFVEPVELEDNTLPNEFIYGNQSLWFGWHYYTDNPAVGQGGSAMPGMKKYGDKFWASDRSDGGKVYRMNLLVSDFDLAIYTGWQAGHPDDLGLLRNDAHKQSNFLGAFTITVSYWQGAGTNPQRGLLDMNFMFDDGSVRRQSKVQVNDPDMINIDHSHKQNYALQQVPRP